MENAEKTGDASAGDVLLELKPDAGTALRYYALLFVASTLGIAVCVILFAGATAGTMPLLLIQIAMMEVSFHIGLAGVFLDFYLHERDKRWTLTAKGVRLRRKGGEDRLLRWEEITAAYPKGTSVCLETGQEAAPVKLFFVSAAGRERFYRLYLFKTMYPFAEPPAVDGAGPRPEG